MASAATPVSPVGGGKIIGQEARSEQGHTREAGGMNLSELQVELRHFAAERDWQRFHTPKNLTTALMVESAELAEIFQWMTPEESRLAHRDPAAKQRIGEEVADVLLYLLQVADQSEIDLEQAVSDKLARNGVKHPATRQIARISPARASVPGTHVLLDYENVQPSEADLRHMVPDASQVWVFHGPQQRKIEERFVSFGTGVTAVPISKSGKNALDFHLSFYMGYIASKNPASAMVVVANDKGYEPMLEHAKAMGFVVRRQSHGQVKPAAKKAVATKAVAKKAAAKKVAVKKPAVKQAPAKKAAAKKVSPAPAAKKSAPAKAAPAKKAVPVKPAMVKPTAPAAVKVAATLSTGVAIGPVSAPAASLPARSPTVTADEVRKITENLRKMGDKRPVKPASLRRALKSFLAAETGDIAIEVALGKLVAAGVVAIGAGSEVSYPGFDQAVGSGSAGG
jgi:NTP pyrophosphatase (non-canonical NTP hydrolase)